jgi:formylglycine-generating enzyme required for sulfatase activity
MGKDKTPAICMTQLGAKMYCKWLSAKTGYYYRLPTEAEWEYACRAGTKTAFSFGDDPGDLDDYGWHYGNSDDKYQKVGQKKPNPWGLYDMHGNVAEWVLDQYTPDGYAQFAGKSLKNPIILPTKIDPRVVRGGSWFDDAERARSAARAGSTPNWKAQDPQIPQSVWYLTDAEWVGFRVVRPLRKPTAQEAAKYEIDEEQKTSMIEYREMRGAVE